MLSPAWRAWRARWYRLGRNLQRRLPSDRIPDAGEQGGGHSNDRLGPEDRGG